MSDKQNQIFDEIHEECGVFGMYDLDGGEVASTIWFICPSAQRTGKLWYRSQRHGRTKRKGSCT